MAQFSTTLQSKVAFFHSKSKTLTEGTQAPYESSYKSAHSTRSADIWADVVAYAVDVAAADVEAGSNLAVTKYTLQTLTMIGGSNGQSYYLDDGGTFVKPFISPTDVPHPTTAVPSYGYQANLYQSDNTLVTPTEGRFQWDYYAGMVTFEVGFTPTDMGWGTPKATLYAYTGDVGATGGESYESFTINQVAHGFTVLDSIYHDGADWQGALTTSPETLGTHVVVQVIDVDNFVAGQVGRYTITAHGLTIGEFYYTGAVPGTMTDTPPGTWSNPMLYVEDANTVHLLNYRPSQAGALGIVISGDGIEETKITGEAVTTSNVLIVGSLDTAFIASNTAPGDENVVYGIAQNDALLGESVDIRTRGEYEDAGWAWTPGGVLYLSTNGDMTQTLPGAGFVKKVGFAITATKIHFNVEPSSPSGSLDSIVTGLLEINSIIQDGRYTGNEFAFVVISENGDVVYI